MVRFMNRFNNRCLFYSYRDLSVIICSVILFLLLIFSFIIFFFVKFNFCQRHNGYVVNEGGAFYVSIMVSDSWISKIQNFSLVYDRKNISYRIVRIDDEYIFTESGLKRSVVIDFDIPNEKKIINNVLELCFMRKMTFFDRVKEMFI